MKFATRPLLVITFTLGATWLVAQVATKKGGLEARLAQALKLYPDADVDKNGTLSVDEALKYLEAHPELKAVLATKSKQGGAKTSEPGEFTTPTSSGLPPGPRVFVCAHSFMIFTATMLPKMTEEAGIGYQDAGRQIIGGSRTLQHWEVPDDQNLAKKALSESSVDVLTLSPHMLLPDEGIDNFTKLGLEKNPKLRVLVQASWPARDGGHTISDERGESRGGAVSGEVWFIERVGTNMRVHSTGRSWLAERGDFPSQPRDPKFLFGNAVSDNPQA